MTGRGLVVVGAELFYELASRSANASFVIANTIKTATDIQAMTVGILAAIRLNSRHFLAPPAIRLNSGLVASLPLS